MASSSRYCSCCGYLAYCGSADVPSEILVALIVGSASVVSSLIAAGVALYGVSVSKGNRTVIDTVKKQTDGLMQIMRSDAKAAGVTEGHAAGVKAGVKAGAAEERDHPSKTD